MSDPYLDPETYDAERVCWCGMHQGECEGPPVRCCENCIHWSEVPTPPLCPRCGLRVLNGKPVRNALSRKDNKTYMCGSCGTDEAMLQYRHGRDYDVWPGHPGLAWRSAWTS